MSSKSSSAKRRPVIRVGDYVRILNYRPIERVGYDLGLQNCFDDLTEEQVTKAAAALGFTLSGVIQSHQPGRFNKLKYALAPFLHRLSPIGDERRIHFLRVRHGGNPFEMAHPSVATVFRDKTSKITEVTGKRVVACGFRGSDEDGKHFEQTSRHVLINTYYGELLAEDVELVENPTCSTAKLKPTARL